MGEPTRRPRKPLSRRQLVRSAVGVATAGAVGRVGAQETDPGTANDAGRRHTVSMTDQLVFDPADLTIAPGDVIVWENVGQVGHSVTAYADDIPTEADYFASGGFDSETAARDAYVAERPETGDVGEDGTYERRFETEGSYDYFCIPHEAAGMVASFEVRTATPARNGGPSTGVPEGATRIGITATVAMLSVVVLAYLLLKYGDDYEP